MMTALDFELSKAQLAREILCTDSPELVEALRRAARRFMKRQTATPPPPYTLDEINAMMDESEADDEAGRTIDSDEMTRRMKRYLATL